ncbi:hypothetical protein SAMN04487934_103202 [Eubacterium ruminantium]|nr:hypothetical protein SAMN04487934_103202 [Eubacterium ruminantium]
MAIILGVLGVVIALIGGVLVGVIGGGIGLVLGVVAFLIGIKKQKNGESGGSAGAFTGIAAFIVGLLITLICFGVASTIKKTAEDNGADRVVECVPSLKFGIVGFAYTVDDKGYNFDEIIKEIESLDSSK